MLLISTQCELTDRPTELYSGMMGGAAQPYYPHPLILLNSLPQTSLTTKIFDKLGICIFNVIPCLLISSSLVSLFAGFCTHPKGPQTFCFDILGRKPVRTCTLLSAETGQLITD